MGVFLILCYYICFVYFHQLTLSVCDWRWSCDSLHETRYWYRWCWGWSDDGV